MFIKAYASGGAGGRGVATPGARSGRGFRSQSAYYRATGMSGLGASSRTRGRLAPITRVTRGR